MLTLVISVALLILLLNDAECCDTIPWNNCSQHIEYSLRGIVSGLGKNQIILLDVSICKRLTVTLKDLEVHPDCGVRNCYGIKQDCKEQKLGFHVKNFIFRCELGSTGVIMKELGPNMRTMKAKSGMIVDGVWSELKVTVAYRVACDKGKGTANMIKRQILSKPGSLSISCSEGNGPLENTCRNVSKSPANRNALAKIAERTLEEKAPVMLKSISENVANMYCQ